MDISMYVCACTCVHTYAHVCICLGKDSSLVWQRAYVWSKVKK